MHALRVSVGSYLAEAVFFAGLASVVAIPVWAAWTSYNDHRGWWALLAGVGAIAWLALLVALV